MGEAFITILILTVHYIMSNVVLYFSARKLLLCSNTNFKKVRRESSLFKKILMLYFVDLKSKNKIISYVIIIANLISAATWSLLLILIFLNVFFIQDMKAIPVLIKVSLWYNALIQVILAFFVLSGER